MKLLEIIKKLNKKKIVSAFIIIVVACILFFLIDFQLIWKMTCEYNEAANTYNRLSKEYDKALENTCIDNVDGIPLSYGTLETVSENYKACIDVWLGENNAIKISKDTATIMKYCEDIETLLVVVKQITVPKAEWVQERVLEIDEISNAELVTEEKNPDGLLNKDGGYVGCVYFSLYEIDQTTVKGDSVVEKGTDCGGAVEVYATVEDAEARCEYLAGFDGTILYSGSYAIVGTTVVRISYKLSNEKQMEMTDIITKKLTEIKGD